MSNLGLFVVFWAKFALFLVCYPQLNCKTKKKLNYLKKEEFHPSSALTVHSERSSSETVWNVVQNDAITKQIGHENMRP